MIDSIYAKLAGLVIVLVLLLGMFLWGHHVGASSVQSKWDKANASQTVAAAKASETARAAENSQATDFAGIANTYLQATTYAYPSIADALPAAVDAGTVRLRHDCPSPAGGGGAAATAGSRSADAAATQALANRVEAAIAAVRVGEQADTRNSQLSAQIQGLQAVLTAERVTQPGTSQ